MQRWGLDSKDLPKEEVNWMNHHSKSVGNHLSSDSRRIYDEARAKALSDEVSRMEGAKREGILMVAKSCIDSGMSISEVAKHTPYEAAELERLLHKYKII